MSATIKRVSDMIREMVPFLRNRLSKDEMQLGILLRGNTPLYESLCGIIRARIAARASVPAPSEPLVCKSMMERDRELQWLLSRLDLIYRSPMLQPDESSEPSA